MRGHTERTTRRSSLIEMLESRRMLSDTLIQGVLPVAMDLPRINAIIRRSPTGNPLEADGLGYNVTAYFDTGTTGILLSQETQQLLGINSQQVNGVDSRFYDVGVAGPEPFGISEPLYMSLANFDGMSLDEPALTEYGAPIGPVRTQISLTAADDLVGPLDIWGMPMFAGKVAVIDPRPLISGDIEHVDYVHTFLYAPGTPYHPATDATDPGIPSMDYHIKLSYGAFDRFTFVDPAGTVPPTTADNPFIGPDPVRKLDDPTFSDGTPPVTIAMGSANTSGSFLLDTGAQASFISQAMAQNVGVHYAAGTYGSDAPVLVDAQGNALPNQFTLSVGGIGGSIEAAGFYLDRLVMKTTEGTDLVFAGAPVLVLDVTVEDPNTGQTLTLDGDLGMNYFLASMEVQDGLPGNVSAGAFDWVTIDQPNGTIGLSISTYKTPVPVFSGFTPDTGIVGDGITSARNLTFTGTSQALTQITLYRDGAEIGSTEATLDGTWTFNYTATTLANGTYQFTATQTDLLGKVSDPTAPLAVTVDGTAPTVSQLKVNDGDVQRSQVRTVTVTFSEPVTLGNAISVSTRSGGSIPNVTVKVDNPSGDQRTFVVSFSGTGTGNLSLPDGAYSLSVNPSAVHDIAGNVETSVYRAGFFRLYGDLNGDRQVNATDIAVFRQSFGKSPGASWWLDFNGDGLIDVTDYNQFRKRVTKRLL